MAKFQGPASNTTVANEFQVVSSFWSVVDGLFIWEFLTTIDYEWSLIRGRRPYRWTIWIYSLTRVATLTAVMLNVVTTGTLIPVECGPTVITQFSLAYLALASASLLIVLRIIAIWNGNRVIVAMASGMWVTNISFLIQGICRLRVGWVSEKEPCGLLSIEATKLSTIVALFTDIGLLLIMLCGLFYLRCHGGGTMTLGRLLWNQGVIWLLLAIAAEVTPTIFICLNLRDPLRLAFQTPWIVTMSIAATRMYRSLSDFLSSDVSHKIPQKFGPKMLVTEGTSVTSIPLTGIQVAVHVAHERHLTPLMSGDNSYISMDSGLCGRPATGPGLDLKGGV